MTWWRYVVTDGDSDDALHAALMVDVVRGNLQNLIAQAPAGCGSPIENGVTTALTSTVDVSASFPVASTLVRQNICYLRARRGAQTRNLRFAFWASMSAGTGTLRACITPAWRIPADPPLWPDLAVETAAGAVTTTATWHVLDLSVSRQNCALTRLGGAPLADGGADVEYPVFCFVLQGGRNGGGGGNTLSVHRVSYEERSA